MNTNSPNEQIAAEQRRADNELAQRMAMSVLGIANDPLKAAVEKAVTGRVDLHGRLTKGPGGI